MTEKYKIFINKKMQNRVKNHCTVIPAILLVLRAS